MCVSGGISNQTHPNQSVHHTEPAGYWASWNTHKPISSSYRTWRLLIPPETHINPSVHHTEPVGYLTHLKHTQTYQFIIQNLQVTGPPETHPNQSVHHTEAAGYWAPETQINPSVHPTEPASYWALMKHTQTHQFILQNLLVIGPSWNTHKPISSSYRTCRLLIPPETHTNQSVHHTEPVGYWALLKPSVHHTEPEGYWALLKHTQTHQFILQNLQVTGPPETHTNLSVHPTEPAGYWSHLCRFCRMNW